MGKKETKHDANGKASVEYGACSERIKKAVSFHMSRHSQHIPGSKTKLVVRPSSIYLLLSPKNMSTSIALQNLSISDADNNTVRHRKSSRTHVKSRSSEDDDPWLDTPHDREFSSRPLDPRSLKPTAVYWISPHALLSKKITILNLTKDMEVPYTGMTAEYKAEIKRTMKDHSFAPVLTCHRRTWLGLKYEITDDQSAHVAHWSHAWSSFGESVLTFPVDSAHSSHAITLSNKRWGLRTESFVYNSQPYVWQMDSLWHSTNMTLYRITGSGEQQIKTEVAKYAQKWWGSFVTGGTVVVDGTEIDGAVACLTLVVVLKKKRQRAAERHEG